MNTKYIQIMQSRRVDQDVTIVDKRKCTDTRIQTMLLTRLVICIYFRNYVYSVLINKNVVCGVMKTILVAMINSSWYLQNVPDTDF